MIGNMGNYFTIITNPSHYLNRLKHYIMVKRYGAYHNFKSLFMQVFRVSRNEIEKFVEEFNQGGLRFNIIHSLEEANIVVNADDLFSKDSWVMALYCIIRLIKPHAVMETGVFAGVSSAFILQAMYDNKKGHLWSIDLPSRADELGNLPGGMIQELPHNIEPGFTIPEALRERWTLIIGRSQEKLPPLLKSIESIDIFLHDSEHSYSNMMWEYKTAWPYIASGGLLLSDDAGVNLAMLHFCRSYGIKYNEFKRKFGILIKP